MLPGGIRKCPVRSTLARVTLASRALAINSCSGLVSPDTGWALLLVPADTSTKKGRRSEGGPASAMRPWPRASHFHEGRERRWTTPVGLFHIGHLAYPRSQNA